MAIKSKRIKMSSMYGLTNSEAVSINPAISATEVSNPMMMARKTDVLMFWKVLKSVLSTL